MHDSDHWEREWQAAGGFWRHGGDPRLPHAELTSGKHSNGFANASVLICRPELLSRMCAALHASLVLREAPDRVVGSAYGSIPFAYELAAALKCAFGFTEREATGPQLLKRFEVKPGETVLVVSHVYDERRIPQVQEAMDAITARGAKLLPMLGTTCNRTRAATHNNLAIISADLSLKYWAPRSHEAIRDGYVRDAIDNPTLLDGVARDFVRECKLDRPPDWVIGSGIEAITLAYQLAKRFGCKAGFTEREMVKTSPLKLTRFETKPREKMLAADDVITTGGTTQETIGAAEAESHDVIGYICAIANRSGKPKLGERDIVSLIARNSAPGRRMTASSAASAPKPSGPRATGHC